MKKTVKTCLAALLAASMLVGGIASASAAGGDDQAAADEVAKMIDAIYVQKRTDETDAQCAAAKAGWDALTDAQKGVVYLAFTSSPSLVIYYIYY